MKMVKISKASTGAEVDSYPIFLHDLKVQIDDQEYFDKAWVDALNDNVIPDDAAIEDYKFEIIPNS